MSKGDVFIMENAWKGTIYPAIGTAESVGIIESVGAQTQGFEVGNRVGIGYILGCCMSCEFCQTGLFQYCEQQKNTELGGWGGFGEHVVVDYRLVVKIPDGLASEEVTPMMCYGVTAFSGIKKASLKDKSKVGIIGLGGLGQILLKLLVAMGHEVTVFSHTPEKESVAQNMGANKFVLTTKSDWNKGVTKYFDLIINASPIDFDLNEYIVLLKALGKFCYLGLPFNRQSFQTTKLADYGSRIIYGSYVGSIMELKEMLEFMKAKSVKPEIIQYPIQEFEKAIKEIKTGIPYKRVVLKW